MLPYGHSGKAAAIPAGNWGNDGAGAAGSNSINLNAYKTTFTDITAFFTDIYAKVRNATVNAGSAEVAFYLGNVKVFSAQISVPAGTDGWRSVSISQNIHADCLAIHVGLVNPGVTVRNYYDAGAANQTSAMGLDPSLPLPNPFVPASYLNIKHCLYGIHT
jgi:hypothetical protein